MLTLPAGITPYYQEAGIVIYHGDCHEVLPQLAPGSVDTLITDPPYHLVSQDKRDHRRASPSIKQRTKIGGFMNQAWDGGSIAFDPATWAAALRVAKPGAMLLAFGGTRTWHRLACALEDAGWELRDTLMWVYGSGFPKSHDISKAIDKADGVERTEVIGRSLYEGRRPNAWGGKHGGDNAYGFNAQPEMPIFAPATEAAKEWDGWGSALKPAYEPILLAMKPLDGTFAQNALKWGVAGLNIDGARIETDQHPGLHKSFSNQGHPGYQRPWRDGSTMPEYKPTPHGRWPANIILDEAAAALLDHQAGDHPGMSGGRATDNRKSGHEAIPSFNRKPSAPFMRGDSGPVSRFFYVAKADRLERQGDLGEANTHPTVKPLALMKYLCLLTETPTGGLILDPFAGSGTTLVAAKALRRPCIGIEQDEASCQTIVNRLRQEVLALGEEPSHA